MMMNKMTEEVRQGSPWNMMFAGDIVIGSESREQVEKSCGERRGGDMHLRKEE